MGGHHPPTTNLRIMFTLLKFTYAVFPSLNFISHTPAPPFPHRRSWKKSFKLVEPWLENIFKSKGATSTI